MCNVLNNNNVDNDLANAISMDELLAMVKEHIHELYQKPNNANTSKNHTSSIEVLQRSY